MKHPTGIEDKDIAVEHNYYLFYLLPFDPYARYTLSHLAKNLQLGCVALTNVPSHVGQLYIGLDGPLELNQ